MRWLKGIAVVTLGLSTSSCSWLDFGSDSNRGIFPLLDSARAQYYYAAEIDRSTIPGRGADAERKLTHIIAAYQQVIDHFPEDQYFTPLAIVSIGNCYFRMGSYRRAYYRKTIQVLKRAQASHPNYPYVHAAATWWIGRSLEYLGRDREAKEYYKQCIDTFRHNENAQIQAFVKLCADRWVKPAIPGR